MPLPDDLITMKRAAHILGVSVNTTRRYVRSRKLKGYTIAGTRKRVSETEVRALIVEDNRKA